MMYDEIDIEVEAIKATIISMRAYNESAIRNDQGLYAEEAFFPFIERLGELRKLRVKIVKPVCKDTSSGNC
jgi:hypothetical protein